MTDAEKAAEEAAMKTAEQEMMESAAPYTPPEGWYHINLYFYCPIVAKLYASKYISNTLQSYSPYYNV